MTGIIGEDQSGFATGAEAPSFARATLVCRLIQRSRREYSPLP